MFNFWIFYKKLPNTILSGIMLKIFSIFYCVDLKMLHSVTIRGRLPPNLVRRRVITFSGWGDFPSKKILTTQFTIVCYLSIFPYSSKPAYYIVIQRGIVQY